MVEILEKTSTFELAKPQKKEGSAGASYAHNRLILFLSRILVVWLEHVELDGRVIGPKFTMHTDIYPGGRTPDLMYVTPENISKINPTHLEGPADLAIEVVELVSANCDRNDKFLEYQAAGVREYWIVDPRIRSAQLWQLNQTGIFQRVPPNSEGLLVSSVIPGLALKPSWLWQDDLPKLSEVMNFWSARG